MNCPVCDNVLKSVTAGGVTVDVCMAGCGGIWFDNFELQKFDEPHEREAEMLIQVNTAKRPIQDDQRKRRCPKCADIPMMRHFFSPQKRVEVDECPNCGGYWLDAGELALIRDECRTEQERRKAVAAYFTEVGRQQTQAMEKGGPEQIARARRISQIVRFTTPFQYQMPVE